MKLPGTSLTPQILVSLKHDLMGFTSQYKTLEFLVFNFNSLMTVDFSIVAQSFANTAKSRTILAKELVQERSRERKLAKSYS